MTEDKTSDRHLASLQKCLAILLLTLIIAFLASSCGMSGLPVGEHLGTYPSPDRRYVIKTFLADGGATVDYAIRAEVIDANGKTRNIYWGYHESSATVRWTDLETVLINDRILNVTRDTYDWRR